MDRLTRSAAFAAVLLSFTLAGCGGGSSSGGTADTAAAPSSGASSPTTTTTTVQGVSTPSSVSVVTAKNAQ